MFILLNLYPTPKQNNFIILVHHHVRTVLHFHLAHLVVVHLLAIVKRWTVMLRYGHKTLVFYLEHHLQLQTLSFVIRNFAQSLKTRRLLAFRFSFLICLGGAGTR